MCVLYFNADDGRPKGRSLLPGRKFKHDDTNQIRDDYSFPCGHWVGPKEGLMSDMSLLSVLITVPRLPLASWILGPKTGIQCCARCLVVQLCYSVEFIFS